MMNQQQPQPRQRSSPTTEATTDEFYDPLPYRRSTAASQFQNNQTAYYDQTVTTAHYPFPQEAPRKSNGDGIIEPAPIWQPATAEAFDDSNPIPIQPRYAQKGYELGQSTSGLHIPKQQGWRTGESKADSFQGRPFYPPQQQALAPNNHSVFQLSNVRHPHQQRLHQQISPRGTTPIPTLFGPNRPQPSSPQQDKKKPKTSPERTANTKKRSWHSRSLDSTKDANKSWNHSYIWRVNQMLEEAPTKGFQDVVSWQTHGRAFKIHKPGKFTKDILPRYFETSQFAHFRRWLLAWGFCQHREGLDRDAFYHRYFVRGVVVSLLPKLSRLDMFEAMRGWVGPGEVPDFASGQPPSIPSQRKSIATMKTTIATTTQIATNPASKSGEQDIDDETHKNSTGDLIVVGPPKDPKRLRGTLLEDLRRMLEDAKVHGFDQVVSWLPGGKAFKVHDTVAFQNSVCGKYFQTNLLRSFSDSLRTWGFCRLWEAEGLEKNAYYHSLFQQNKPHLCRHYSREQMRNAMKDFREEQKRQREISWSLFPYHRENPQTKKASRDDLSDAEDSGDEAEPLRIDASNLVPTAQDYLIPYLNRNENSNDNAVVTDSSLRPSFVDNCNIGPYDPIEPPTGKEAAKKGKNASTQLEASVPNDNQIQKIEDLATNSERQTGFSYVIRISMMLEDIERKGKEHIVSWRSHGRAFKIHDEASFCEEILPRYFSATSLASFHRWLNKWGFLRIQAGKDRRSWYHRLFVRGVVDLLKGFTQRQMFLAMEEWRAPGKEPDFYCSGKGDELSDLPVLKSPTKEQKKDKTIEEKTSQNQTSDAPPSPKQLLEPTKDPKVLRGMLVEKLREMLDVVQTEGSEDIVSWLPHGRAFKIHNSKAFSETILNRFFGVSKYRYFGDVLRSWGFVILKSGIDKGSFYHRCFRRDKPRLCLHLSRTQLKSAMKDFKKGTAPDLYKEDDKESQPTSDGDISTGDLSHQALEQLDTN